MTLQNNLEKPARIYTSFNPIMIAALLVTTVYALTIGNNASAMIILGMSLIFDPFKPTKTFAERPRYQKLWLVLYPAAVLVAFIFIEVTRKTN